MNNSALPETLAKLSADIERSLGGIEDAITGVHDQLALWRLRPAPRVTPADISSTWPWTTETVTQGFLAARWLRRDGTVYPIPATTRASPPNSPIAGGQDVNAKVSTSSGVRRG